MFLPTTAKEVEARGWDELDVIIFSGDAYIDHPAFGPAVIGRLLEAEGYRVAIVPQPNWRDDLRDFKKLGKPRLFFAVSAGAMDSMVNHYTANLRLRSNDAYTAGGKAGFRPDRTVDTYTKILKQLYPHTPVVVGGIEASLRRLTHYDYWSDRLQRSILLTSGADLLVYGMGDKVISEVARAMRNGFNMKLLRGLRQVGFRADAEYVKKLCNGRTIILNSFEECEEDKVRFCENFTRIEQLSNMMECDTTLVERAGDDYVVITPPNVTLTTEELDRSFDLPYERAPHPRYKGKGDIAAWEMIKHSVNIHRGCFGGCSFCTISAHQGKFINSRSERSILEEVKRVTQMPDFKGYLSDVGAPSANMYRMRGHNEELCRRCKRPSCLHPKLCPNMNNDHKPLLELYRKIREIKGIKKAFIGSGIRYDLFDDSPYFETVVKHHTSGRLKVAPEHTEDHVLRLMRKPSFELFEQLNSRFKQICRREELKYQLIPYFISSHPGCREADMQALSRKVLGRLQFNLEQVQDLTPTPMTLSSVMFYTGMNPYTMEPLYVARSQDDKRRQKSYFFDENGAPQRGETSRSDAKRVQGGKGGYKSGGRATAQRGGRVERPQRDKKFTKKR
ncbi:MAG: YgiQ family radical SAM protein [Alistipes sp.]|nr:YgiQ family radical SAM protein [Alistipes sp.]